MLQPYSMAKYLRIPRWVASFMEEATQENLPGLRQPQKLPRLCGGNISPWEYESPTLLSHEMRYRLKRCQ